MNPDTTTFVSGIATALLGGGGTAALVSVYSARKKVPAERDSIVVTGAETAVLTLEKTLAAETRRADRAEAQLVERTAEVERKDRQLAMKDSQIARKDERIANLEARLDRLQELLDEARDELHAIIAQG